MRKLVRMMVLSVVAMAFAPSLGATYFKEGSVWKTYRIGTTEPNMEREYYRFYLKVDDSDDSGSVFNLIEESAKGDLATICLIKEEDNRIYFFDNFTSQWYLLYDFNLKEGDCVCAYTPDLSEPQYQGPTETYVKCVGEELYEHDSTPWPALKLEEYGDADYTDLLGEGVWLKGLGSPHGLIENCGFDYMAGMGSKLYEVVSDDDVVYKAYVASASLLKSEEVSLKCTGRLVSLSGVVDGSSVAVYSVDGRKVASCKASGATADVILPQSGAYMIAVGDSVFKVLAR